MSAIRCTMAGDPGFGFKIVRRLSQVTRTTRRQACRLLDEAAAGYKSVLRPLLQSVALTADVTSDSTATGFSANPIGCVLKV